MSILGGLVDSHHETELSPSTQLIHSTWPARHVWMIFAVITAAAVAASFWVTV